MNILLIEDQAEKRRLVADAISAVAGIDTATDLDCVSDAYAARRALQAKSYDLAVLDLVLPERAERPPDESSGLRLLDALFERPGFLVPSHVIGLTAHEAMIESSNERFERRLLTLLYFDPTSTRWSDRLKERIRHILLAKASEATDPPSFGVKLAILCALDEPELRHVLRLPWNWEQVSIPNDHCLYHQGTVFHEERSARVIAAAVGRMGMPAAASLAMKMILAFRPQYVAMPGIAAGVRARTNMGDVIFADPCWDWGSGKRVSVNSEIVFRQAPHQLGVSSELRVKARALAGDSQMLAAVKDSWTAERPNNALSLRLGPLASGSSVLADGRTITGITDQHRELLGIDMEAYGVFAAGSDAPEPRPTVFALKSVVDFADGENDDRFQEYASYTSASLLKLLAEQLI